MSRFESPLGRSIVAAVLALASHAPVVLGGFAWLDHGDLEAGAAIAPPSGWLALFVHPFARTGFYRPLPALSLSVDALFGGGPLPFHLHSWLAHAAVAVSLGFAAEALGLSRRAALVAAAIFAVHPIGGFVGGLIAFRPELMMAIGLLWLIWAAKHENVWLAAGAMLFACLSKETAFLLAPIFVLVLRARRVIVPAAVAWAAALAARLAFAPMPHAGGEADIGTRLAALGRGLLAMVAPYETALCDATPVIGVTFGGVFALACVVGVSFVRRPAGVMLAVSLLPAFNLVALPRFWSLHYFYLPLAMLTLVIAHRWLWPLVLVAALSFGDAGRFKNDETLWTSDCREGALYLGDVYRARGELDRAAASYELAVRPTPGIISFSDEAAGWQNLGLTRLAQARLDDAQAAFEQALQRQGNALERRKLNHDLAAVSFARRDFADVEKRLANETFPQSIELLQRARAAAQSPPP